jgi:hypothetical protein
MARLHILSFGSVLSPRRSRYCCRAAQAVEPETTSGTVLSGGNSSSPKGSVALQDGRIAAGIRLTQEGLKDATDPREAASGHSNLCAGYALLRDWAHALEQCNTAIRSTTPTGNPSITVQRYTQVSVSTILHWKMCARGLSSIRNRAPCIRVSR